MARSGFRAHYLISDAIEHLYDVFIFDKSVLTTVTKHPEAVTEWIDNVDNYVSTLPRYVGFDLNTVDGMDDVIGNVQLCVGTRCLVIQLIHMEDYPPSLAQFLVDPQNIFCGIDVAPKIDVLMGLLCVDDGQVASRDLGVVAAERYQRPELRNANHCDLVMRVFGIELEMPRVLEPDWDGIENLAEVHVEYACVQAFVSFVLGTWLIVRDGGNN